jgi:N-acetyl-gamma-glutamylphosphate reductase
VRPQWQLLHGGTQDDGSRVGGATGYIGAQILRQLLHQLEFEHIGVQVRADSAAHGLQHVVESAYVTQQWLDALLLNTRYQR